MTSPLALAERCVLSPFPLAGGLRDFPLSRLREGCVTFPSPACGRGQGEGTRVRRFDVVILWPFDFEASTRNLLTSLCVLPAILAGA
jgi:hypothetical protein